MIEVPVGHGKVAIVDDEDIDLLHCHCWNLAKKYPCASWQGKTIYLHVEIAKRKFNREIPDQVDHEDRNPLNCRRYNLRLATNSENKMNKDTAYLSSTGYKGVHYRKELDKYVAKIWNNDKQYHLGCFRTAQEAAIAYNNEAVRLYGEFAVLNKL
jgi:hypothetical protein